jgi:hypothetical protein
MGGAGAQLHNGYGTGTLGEDAQAHRSGVTVGARGRLGFGRMGVNGVSGIVGCTGAVGTATVRAGAAARGVGGWSEMSKRLAAHVLAAGGRHPRRWLVGRGKCARKDGC